MFKKAHFEQDHHNAQHCCYWVSRGGGFLPAAKHSSSSTSVTDCRFDRAGVFGLTCALQLSKQAGNAVTVVGKHMPGDYVAQCGDYGWPSASFGTFVRRLWFILILLSRLPIQLSIG